MIELDELLLVGNYEARCHVLGPGTRFVLWVQGCPFTCEGCIAESMHSFDGGTLIPVSDLVELVLRTPDIEGITVSGGEPFMQAPELSSLFAQLREKSNLGIIVYTGFIYETLLSLHEKHPEIRDMLSYIDLLIDGPYVEDLNHNSGQIGSVNQRTILLTDRYKDDLYLYHSPEIGRRVEWHTKDGQTLMAGVPSKQLAQQWKEMKQNHGQLLRKG